MNPLKHFGIRNKPLHDKYTLNRSRSGRYYCDGCKKDFDQDIEVSQFSSVKCPECNSAINVVPYRHPISSIARKLD